MEFKMKFLFLIAMAFSISGCVALTSVSTTPVPVDRSHSIHAEGNRFLFLLLNFDTNFVDNMVSDLAKQCPNGKVQGILTKQEDIVYFPIIAHAYRVSADGYCVKGK